MKDPAVQREYAAATEDAGVFAIGGWATVRVTGRDRASFLHNMCTNDIKGLPAGGGCEAFFTDVKGKIVAHAFILAKADDTELITPAGEAAKLISHLDRYIIREDVQLANASEEVAWTLATGRRAGIVLGQFAPSIEADLSQPWSHATIQVDNIAADAARCELPWCGGWLVSSVRSDAASLRSQLERAGAALCSEDVWHAIRVESAWPLWGVDFDDSNLPQEVGRDAQAIHFRKGCYLGQETVARVDALGHVNKRLVQVRFDGDQTSAVGAEVAAGGQSVGRITSAAWSPRSQAPLALAMVRRGANDAGSKLICGEQGGEVLPAAGA